MEEECRLQEFYRASNKVQLVRMSSFIDTDNSSTTSSTKKRSDDYDNLWKATARPVKRSSTIYVKSSQIMAVVLPNRQKTYPCIRSNESDPPETVSITKDVPSATPKEEAKTQPIDPAVHPKSDTLPHKAFESSPDSKKAPVELGLGGISLQQKALKAKLTESLSPSPFKEVSQENHESELKQLASSAETKQLLLAPVIYGSEVEPENSHYWKKALKDYILHTLQSICVIKKLKEVPPKLLASKSITLAPTPGKKGTIIFDLDETLVHCVTDDIQKADQQITVTLKTGEQVKAGINVRPHAVECLIELAKDFELMVFTASHPYYADHAIDLLDPDKTIFSHRLFRNNCIQTDSGFYIKDLRILNRDLASVIIVDNSILSFAFQLDNGIPIIPFYDDKEDTILPKIKDYILSLRGTEDFRRANKAAFSLKELYDLNVQSFLKYYTEEESDDDPSGDSFDNSLEELDAENATGTEEDQLVTIRRQSMSGVDRYPRIGKKVKAAVESELGKLRVSLPRYLAGQQKGKSDYL